MKETLGELTAAVKMGSSKVSVGSSDDHVLKLVTGTVQDEVK